MLEHFEAVYPDNFNFAYDVIDEIAAAEPERRAMVWCDDKGNERVFSFSDISKGSKKAANVLSSLGINRSDKVILILKRHWQFWMIVLGLHRLGAVAIPATNQLRSKDIEERCNAAGIKGIICTAQGDSAEQAEGAFPDCPTLEVKMIVNGERDGWLYFNDLFDGASDDFERRETLATDTMLLYFTSGTEGLPKMVTHDFTYPLGHIVTAKYWQCVDPDGLHLTISDTGWMKAMWGKLYGQWFMEAGIFVCDFDKFTPQQLLPLFKKYNITTFCAPPTMFRMFIKNDLDSYDLSSLKNACIAGEALNPEVFSQFKRATGLKLMEGFGQTESTVLICNQKGMEPKPGSMGKPSPAYDVVLLDTDGKPVPCGTTGEICVKVGEKKPVGLFSGYYRGEDKLTEVLYDGYYHTKDLAWTDEDGYIWYVGRNDDVIKSSGYRIGPFEIESVLMEHPAVLECAVTGYPDATRGQLVKASIILAPGYEPSDELAQELKDYAKLQTAPYKYPRMIKFVETLPKTISGKIKRAQIRIDDLREAGVLK